MVDRLDEERIEILRAWGAGLAVDRREELRAAGKAISVLIEEIDRLQVDLWNARAMRVEEDRREHERVPDPSPLKPTLLERLAGSPQPG